jgi:hypothetical protein
MNLPPMEAGMAAWVNCEVHAALLASRIAVSFGCAGLIIEGDSLLTIFVVIRAGYLSYWSGYRGYRLPTDNLSVNRFLIDYRPIKNDTKNYRSHR